MQSFLIISIHNDLSNFCSIDPIYIDDPLFPTNNVGRNCFRIHQCIKVSCFIFFHLVIDTLNMNLYISVNDEH